jgi:hypothetical protein
VIWQVMQVHAWQHCNTLSTCQCALGGGDNSKQRNHDNHAVDIFLQVCGIPALRRGCPAATC